MKDDSGDSATEIETLEEALEYIEHLEGRLAEQDETNSPETWPKIIELDPPISLGTKGEPVSELRVRQPRLGDLWGIAVNPQQWTFTDILNVGQKLTTVSDSGKCVTMAMMKKLPAKQGSLITTAVRVFFLECL